MEFADPEEGWRFEGSEVLGRCPFAFCFSSQAEVHISTIVPVNFLLFCLNELCHSVPHDRVPSEIEATPKEEFHSPLSFMDGGKGILGDGTSFLYSLDDCVDFLLYWSYPDISS